MGAKTKLVNGKVVPVVRLQSRGRINIPKEILDQVSADHFAIEVVDGKIVLEPLKLEE